MATLPNKYELQKLVDDQATTVINDVLGFGKYVDWSRSSKFKGDYNAGATRQFRRESQYLGQDEGINVDRSIANTGVGPNTNISALTEPVWSMSLMHSLYAQVECGWEDFLLDLSSSQYQGRHLDKLIKDIGIQAEGYIATDVLSLASQHVGTPGVTPVGANVQTNLSDAEVLLLNRGVWSTERKRVMLNPAVSTPLRNLLYGQFHAGSQIDKTWSQGTFGQFAGWELDTTPILPSVTVAAYGSSLTYVFNSVTGNNGSTYTFDATKGYSVWVPYTSITISGLAVNTTIKAGTQISFNSVYRVTPILQNLVPQTLTLTVSQDATVSGGVATVIVREPIIAAGPYKNVNKVPVSGTDALTILGQGATNYPSIGFVEGAIVGAKVTMPPVDTGKQMVIKAGPLDIRIWSWTSAKGQNLIQARALFGIDTPTPERLVTINAA